LETLDMDDSVAKAGAWRRPEGQNAAHACKPTGRDAIARRVLMSAGAMVLALLFVAATLTPLHAQTYPNKPIRFIVPFPPGATDLIARIVGSALAERLGQPVVIDNRPGAGGLIGIEAAAKARPDGYTIVIGSAGALACSPSLYKKLNFTPIKDFAPLSLVAQTHWLLFVRASSPINTLKELVAYARANPGKLTYGTSGVGGTPHLAGELFKSVTRINIVHVPYKGGGLALIALMGGEIDLEVTNLPTVLAQLEARKVRALTVLHSERLPLLPDVPAVKETGVEACQVMSCEVTGWYGILAPAGTPREVVNRLSAEWGRSVATPNTRDQIRKAGLDPLAGTPAQFFELLETETVRWARIIKGANITLDLPGT
jgi:tripartite-type tricarboxylate transporter receptor subunit TctC